MLLHPEAAVAALLQSHRSALAQFHGHLEVAVPKVCAMWEPLYPDIAELPGDTLCGDVRAAVWRLAKLTKARGPRSLRIGKLPPNSKQLVDVFDNSTRIRLRRHPWDYRDGQRVQVERLTADQEPLFGDAQSLAYDFAILWEPELRTGVLRSAFLAAVYGLDTSKVAIYAREPLPGPTFNTNSSDGFGDNGPPDDGDFGFDEDTGDDPA